MTTVSTILGDGSTDDALTLILEAAPVDDNSEHPMLPGEELGAFLALEEYRRGEARPLQLSAEGPTEGSRWELWITPQAERDTLGLPRGVLPMSDEEWLRERLSSERKLITRPNHFLPHMSETFRSLEFRPLRRIPSTSEQWRITPGWDRIHCDREHHRIVILRVLMPPRSKDKIPWPSFLGGLLRLAWRGVSWRRHRSE